MILSYFLLNLLFCVFSHQLEPNDYDFIYFDGIRTLSEMPMQKLLRLKSSFVPNYGNESFNLENMESRTFHDLDYFYPRKRYPMRRYEEWEEKGKNSKISKIFYLTISALSFLAFGGYLITLVVTAINQHNNNSSSTPSNVIYLSNYKRPKRKTLFFNSEIDYDTEMLYKGMIILSQDFTKLN